METKFDLKTFGDNDSPNPSIKEFLEYCNILVKEISLKDDGTMSGMHIGYESKILVNCLNEENNLIDYELVGVDISRMIGCGCMSDIVLKIKKVL